MLSGERDSNDRDTQQKGKDQMHYRGIQASADQPNNVTEKVDAAHAVIRRNDPLAKRPKHKPRDLETLQPERDADDRYTQYKAAENIAQGGKESPTDQPYKVSYKIH
jgi:hypothetical protein